MEPRLRHKNQKIMVAGHALELPVVRDRQRRAGSDDDSFDGIGAAAVMAYPPATPGANIAYRYLVVSPACPCATFALQRGKQLPTNSKMPASSSARCADWRSRSVPWYPLPSMTSRFQGAVAAVYSSRTCRSTAPFISPGETMNSDGCVMVPTGGTVLSGPQRAGEDLMRTPAAIPMHVRDGQFTESHVADLLRQVRRPGQLSGRLLDGDLPQADRRQEDVRVVA